MENRAFAPKDQMLHFPYFHLHDISKASKGLIMESRVKRSKTLKASKLIQDIYYLIYHIRPHKRTYYC